MHYGPVVIPEKQLNRETIDPDRYYSGHGSGLLLLGPDQTQDFYFTYNNCLDPVPITTEVALAARWKRLNRTMEVRVPVFSPNKQVKFAASRRTSCQINFSLQPVQSVR